MKLKIILLVILTSILVIISFFQVKKEKINYTVIGEKHEFVNNIKSLNYIDLLYNDIKKENKINNYSKEFIYEDIRLIDLKNKILENEKINEKTIQNVIHNSNILLINVGNNELYYKFNYLDNFNTNEKEIYNYLDEIYLDFYNLIKVIRKYSDTKIIYIGYYNKTNNTKYDKYYSYLNNKISKNKEIIFIDIHNLRKNNGNLLNNEENMSIYSKIIDEISCKNIY